MNVGRMKLGLCLSVPRMRRGVVHHFFLKRWEIVAVRRHARGYFTLSISRGSRIGGSELSSRSCCGNDIRMVGFEDDKSFVIERVRLHHVTLQKGSRSPLVATVNTRTSPTIVVSNTSITGLTSGTTEMLGQAP